MSETKMLPCPDCGTEGHANTHKHGCIFFGVGNHVYQYKTCDKRLAAEGRTLSPSMRALLEAASKLKGQWPVNSATRKEILEALASLEKELGGGNG